MADHSSGEAAYPWLNEFLCDYVDGTMDPAARAMFEECLSGNAELMAYVERLRATRHLLCAYGCRNLHAPCNLHQILHQRIARETSDARFSLHLPNRLGVASIALAALLIAMIGGAALPVSTGEPGENRTAFQAAPVSLPSFHADRSPLLPDTLPRSASMLRIRATAGEGAYAP